MPFLPDRDARGVPVPAPAGTGPDGAGRARSPLRRQAVRILWRARFVVAAACCGLAAALVVGALKPPAPPTVAVLVAARDVPAGTSLSAHDVRVAHVPAELAPGSAFRSPGDATGRVASVALDAGTVVAPALVAAGSTAARAPQGRVVVALHLDDDPAVALLGPGDHVDLLAAATASDGGDVAGADQSDRSDASGGSGTLGAAPTSSYLARRALVLPAPRAAPPSGAGLLGSGDDDAAGATLVVAVTPREAEAIAGRADWARVTAVLVR